MENTLLKASKTLKRYVFSNRLNFVTSPEIWPQSMPSLGLISQRMIVSLSCSFHRGVRLLYRRQMYNFLILLLSVHVSLKRLRRVKEMREILITESYHGK